jgi:hypothetical protein
MSFPESPVIALPSPPVVRAFAVALLLGGCQLTPQESVPDTTEDGLERIDFKGIDLAYMRPGASLAQYRRVLLDPVQVAFSKDWNPERTGSRMKLSTEEREKIRTDLAAVFMQTFKEEIEKGGYTVVDAAAHDVLRVTPELADVYINDPDVMTPGRDRTYVMSSGRMTLRADLRDSETGAILARVTDETKDRDDLYFDVSSNVANTAAARRAVQDWARTLRARLDAVRMQSEAAKPMSK